MALGRRASASGAVTSQAQGTDVNLQLYKQVTEPGEFGYRVQGESGTAASVSAQAEYRGSWGDVNAGLEKVRGRVAGWAGIRGSVVFADGGVLVGNTLDNSFVIVDSGLPDRVRSPLPPIVHRGDYRTASASGSITAPTSRRRGG